MPVVMYILNIYFLIEIELIYNIVLVSGIQQRDSFISVYIHILLNFFPLYFIPIY